MRFFFFLIIFTFFYSCSSESQYEQFIFTSSRNGNSDIFLINLSTGQTSPISTSSNEEWGPVQIAKDEIGWLEDRDGDIVRLKLNIKTGIKTEISQPDICILDDKNAVTSPNGQKEVFQCDSNLYLNNKGGGRPINLTKNVGGKCYKPAWFPDSKKVAFTHKKGDNQNILSLRIEDLSLEKLTDHPANEEAPDISPDGNYMVFSSNRDGNQNQEIYLKNLETGETNNISNTPDWELIARFSPSGRFLCWGSNKDGNWELYRYELASGKIKRLTTNDSFDGDPRPLK